MRWYRAQQCADCQVLSLSAELVALKALETGIELDAGPALAEIARRLDVTFVGGRTVLDGPFAEAGEVILGFSIWQVKDMDEAIAWAKRASDPMPGRRSEMEIRPLYEAADLVDFLSPEELAAAARDGKLGVA